MVGEILGPKILGHLYLLIEFTPQKIKLSLIFMTGDSFATGIAFPTETERHSLP